MRALVLASTALVLSLSACKVDTPKGFGDPVLALATAAKSCRDPRGRFAKCQTCPDGSVIWTGAICPVPVPPPEPTPAPSPITGEVPIASPYDPTASLIAKAIPLSAKPDTKGAFRFICNAGQLLRDDPIVYPNQPGKSHLHQFYGYEGVNASSTYATLRTGTGHKSSCEGDNQNPLNKSGYWMPAMLDGLGNVIRPDFVSIYYKRRPLSDPKCSLTSGDPQAQGNCVALPNGLKFIFGFDMLTNEAPTGKLWFNCQGAGSVSGHYPNIEEAEKFCPIGAQLGAVIEAPDCWDGKNLDSPNHRDHVSYGSYGTWGYYKCPATHPYVIPSFTLGAWFTKTAGSWRLSSDEMFPNLPRGTTFHADFFMAWDPIIHMMWDGPDGCINKLLNCDSGDTGNGFRISGMEIRNDTRPKVVVLSSIP